MPKSGGPAACGMFLRREGSFPDYRVRLPRDPKAVEWITWVSNKLRPPSQGPECGELDPAVNGTQPRRQKKREERIKIIEI